MGGDDQFLELPHCRKEPFRVANPCRAEAEREELVDIVERCLALHLSPSLALDHVSRTHRAAIVA